MSRKTAWGVVVAIVLGVIASIAVLQRPESRRAHPTQRHVERDAASIRRPSQLQRVSRQNLPPSIVLRVTVEDVLGGTVAGARLTDGLRNLGATNIDGRVELTNRVGLEASGTLSVVAEGYARQDFRYALPGALTVKLLPESSIRGVVVDVDGRPSAGVVVSATLDGGRASTQTDESGEDGRFALGGLSPGVYEVEGRSNDRYGRADLAVALGLGTTAEVVLMVEPALSIRGMVYENGVALRGQAQVVSGRLQSPVDDDGTFELHGLSPGTYDLRVRQTPQRAIDALHGSTRVQLVDADAEVVLDLGVTHELTIAVRTREGIPIDNASIVGEQRLATASAGSMCVTNAGGVCTLGGLLDAAATRVRPLLAGADWRDVSLPHLEQVEFLVDAPGSIRGRLVDTRGAPLRSTWGLTLQATGQPDASDMVLSTVADAEAWFTFATVPAGSYRLEARPRADDGFTIAPGQAASAVLNVTLDPDEHLGDLVLTVVMETGSIAGRVVDQRGRGVSGAMVSVLASGTRSSWHAWKPGAVVAVSDNEGDFMLEGLDPVPHYTLVALGPDGGLQGNVSNVAVATRDAIIELRPAGRLIVDVRDAGRDRVAIVDGDTIIAEQNRTGTDAPFVFSSVPEGTWMVRRTRGGEQVRQQSVQIVAGETQRLAL